MSPTFHAGEIEIQRRAGVREAGERVGRGIVAGLPEGIDEVLGRQRLAVAASVDAAGRVHASVLDGAEGFLERIDDELLRVGGALPPESRLARDLADNPELGLLVFDPTRRRRLRVNGRALALPAGILLRVRQFYGNCSKYIQLRRLTGEAESFPAAESHVAAQLSAEQARTIAAADTFFLASFHPEGGADASHRGGRPGFVRVPGPERIVFSDYAGNNMFNTLGNLVVHPRVALLFLDFATGDALQVEGRARVARDRTVEVAVDAVAETRGASRWRYELVEASPFNPPLSRSTAGGISKGERDTTPERRPA
jgi:predicted pyridoxine 5'-phosphate oxidase superfamily flavin-nucleotide-binding protein